MSPKISIITACYNSESSIVRTLQSVLSQSYSFIEYIVIDGGSTDKTLSLMEPYRDRFSVFISEPDKGIYDALNKGIRHATGDWIGFLHSDDVFANTKVVERLANRMAGSSNDKIPDGIYANLNYVSGYEDEMRVIRNWRSEPFKPNLLSQGWMPPHPTLYLKKSVYQKWGEFNLNYSIAADYDFILRVFKDSSLTFDYLPETTVLMQTGGASNKSLKNIIKKSKQDLEILKRHELPPLKTLLLKNLLKAPQLFRRGKGT